ncbi:hypothetical protein DD238_004374 [Peronospora effusa]|uniref:Uncharacterized protein n=1 Tax=Peronospora effusa TaxID=542832 RepID=A0A3M6VHH6_9STRA|nr:hypothetical protein DD238_004374 [Peronospora effusa]RQM11679.1 hypothetical protein DD237_004284 [Peronospora effusa]
MLSRLLESYDIGPMVVAATRVPEDKVVLRVEAEVKDLWVWQGRTPDYVFTNLGLDKAGDILFDNHLLLFWTSYTILMYMRHSKYQCAWYWIILQVCF